MRRGRAQAGMTLIEMLIAVTLFGAISAGIGLVLRVAFTSLSKIDAKIDQNRRVLASQRTLDQILSSMIPVVTPCAGLPVGFQGAPAAMRFVSSFSLTEGSRGRLQIVEIFASPHPEGGFRLLLNERPYFGKRGLSAVCAGPTVATANSFILADRLSGCGFAYRRLDKEQGAERWSPLWNVPEWPSGVRVDMAPWKPLSNQILPTTVFARIMVRNTTFEDGNF